MNEEKKPEPITRKVLINHFLLFRFCGSLGIFGVFAIVLTWFKNTKPSTPESFTALGAILIINVGFQLFTLIGAALKFRKDRMLN